MEDVQVAYVKVKFQLAVHNYHQISLPMIQACNKSKSWLPMIDTHQSKQIMQENCELPGREGWGEGVQQCFFYVMHSN